MINKRIFNSVIIVYVLLIVSFNSAKSQEKQSISNEILTGKTTYTVLESPPHNEWFVPIYKDYQVDLLLVEQLIYAEPDKIIIVMGTWCGDSRREVPRFFKIMDKLGWDRNIVDIYAVDRSKTLPEFEALDINVERVPTFFFYNSNKLVGTIVESPEGTLELDMVNIVNP
jgi:thiol-disulfide isomerase/thioredoxin